MTEYIPNQQLMDNYRLAAAMVEILQAKYAEAYRNEKTRLPEIQALMDIALVKQRYAAIDLADEYMNHFGRK